MEIDIQKKKEEAARAAAEAEQARLKAEEEAKQSAFPDDAMNPPEEPVTTMGKVISDIEKQAYERAVQVPKKQWISFQAYLSTEDALALKDFFNSRNIEFKAV